MRFNKVIHPAFKVIKEERKKIKLKKSQWESIEVMIVRMISMAQATKDKLGLYDTVLVGLSVENKGTHYFIEDGDLYEFLRKTPIKDSKAVVACIKNNFIFERLKWAIDDTVYFAGYVHAKIEPPATSFLMLQNKKNVLSLVHSTGSYESEANDIAVYGDGLSLRHLYLKGFGKEDTEKTQMIINMMLYMAAFPEMVENGAPESDRIEYSGKKAKYIRSNVIVKEMARGDVDAHYRRGHFKMLTAERYTKKKGEIIYVRPTFVNGRCVTVNAIDENQEEIERGLYG
jgi:hypothetical protein